MTTYSYHIAAKYDDCETEFRTNLIEHACGEFTRHFGECRCLHVMDGYTGEILAHWGVGEELYTTTEWKYLLTGWAILHL